MVQKMVQNQLRMDAGWGGEGGEGVRPTDMCDGSRPIHLSTVYILLLLRDSEGKALFLYVHLFISTVHILPY